MNQGENMTHGTESLSFSSGGLLLIPEGAPDTLAMALHKAALATEHGIHHITAYDNQAFQSYQQLLEQAQQILSNLQSIGLVPGDKIVFQLDQSRHFVSLLWACFLGGLVAVPTTVASVFTSDNTNANKLQKIWQMLDQPLIVADTDTALALNQSKQMDWSGVKVTHIVELLKTNKPPQEYHAQPDDLALLLFTSGSTGLPKGVTQTHRALLSMAAGTVQMNRFDQRDVSLNWMPLDHVGAIVFLGIMPVYLCCNQMHVPTQLILGQPLFWLDLIQRYRASISWAPNFAFGLINQQEQLLEETGYDLSSMRFLVNAGEQIATRTIRAFLELLEKHQLPKNALRPAFGMSETCSGITWSAGLTREQLADSHLFVSLGKPIPGTNMRITDEHNNVLPCGEIGRLELQGPSVTRGYYDNPEKNQSDFYDDGWFITGDLAYLNAGELVITGREKQEIIINGVNIPAHEIETTIEKLGIASASYTAAFAVASAQQETERLAIAFNPQNSDESTWGEAISQIHKHLVQNMGVAPAFVIPLDKNQIPKTSIGKIQHKQLKSQFDQGVFNDVLEIYGDLTRRSLSADEVPSSEIEKQIAEIWQTSLDLPNVGLKDNFFELGGHSILLIQVHQRLQASYGLISVADLFKYPTVQSLAEYFSGDQEDNVDPNQEAARKQRVDRRRSARQSDIAVIGMACRFPGADNIDEFWNNLRDGIESISFFTDQDILDSMVDPKSALHPNYVKASPILKDAAGFDADLFGYSAKEAEQMDPQHRLFLECCWETLEHAGYQPIDQQHTVGLYAGCAMNTYLLNNVYPNRDQLDNEDDLTTSTLDSMGGFQMMVANDKDYLNTRVSYKLNLRGPSINLQTACSTGLVVIHQAAQSLLSGECDMAIAGTSSVQSPQKIGHLYQEGMIVTPDGHCRAFDADARGTIFGSGVGAVLLKRLDDAQKDGDNILAVIKGSAVNNDGVVKLGFMAPSELGQSAVASEAIAMAGVKPETITFLEAHGTGTELGDPIEVASLSKALRSGENPDQPTQPFCALGSVKTNIGHLQITSGIAGFIKTVLALQHQQIPATLHFKQPNPAIDFANSPFYINTSLQDWHTDGHPRRAAVNSLGIGGTNAHIVLEEAPAPIQFEPVENNHSEYERPLHLLTLSAKGEQPLQELVARYETVVQSQADIDLANLCFTANTGRCRFEHTFHAIFADTEQLQEQLRTQLISPMSIGDNQPINNKVVFMFTGQGSQYPGMARSLYDTQPLFKQILDQCQDILAAYLSHPLLDVIYPDSDDADQILDQTAYAQPAIFAIEYALAKLWISWGIQPDVVIGHSIGEYAAACVAGIFSLEDALKLVTERGRLMQQLPQQGQPGDGQMLAVLADIETIQPLLERYADKVSVAAYNGPKHHVLSGDTQTIQALAEYFTEQGIRAVKLNTSHAFHSLQMQPIMHDFQQVANSVEYHTPEVSFYSNMTETMITDELVNAEYWTRHIMQPVRFYQGMSALCEQGYEVFVELGPKPIMAGMARSFMSVDYPNGNYLLLPSLRNKRPDWQQLLESLARLYQHGVDVDWTGFDAAYVRRRIPLPTYPFQHKRYWLDRPTTKMAIVKPETDSVLHPLVHRKLRLPLLDAHVYETHLSVDSLPLLGDHIVYDQVIVAGAGHLSMLLAAAQLHTGQPQCSLEQIAFPQALILPKDAGRDVQVQFEPTSQQQHTLTLLSMPESTAHPEPTPSIHVTGVLTVLPSQRPALPLDSTGLNQTISHQQIYQLLADRQIVLGSAFSWLNELTVGDGEASFTIQAPPGLAVDDAYQMHPGLIDSMLQPSLMVLDIGQSDATYVPFGMERFSFYHNQSTPMAFPLKGYAKRRTNQTDTKQTIGKQLADIVLVDANNQLIAEVSGFEFIQVNPDSLLKTKQSNSAHRWQIEWRPKSLQTTDNSITSHVLTNLLNDTAALTADMDELLATVNSDQYQALASRLDQLGCTYIVSALQQAGVFTNTGIQNSSQCIAEKLQAKTQYHPVVNRLLQILEQRQLVSGHSQQWHAEKLPQLPGVGLQIQQLEQIGGEGIAAELTMLRACGERLNDILKAQVNPLELMFPNGDLSLATRLYRDSAGFKAMNTLVRNIVSVQRHQLGSERRLRILEIGAGTGATTHYVLSALDPDNTEYVFTDISPLFLNRARQQFSDYSFIDYQLLNIEQSPAAHYQQSFDIVIAANVLHATQNLRETMQHTRQLLKPGGQLLLLEVNEPTVPVDLTFGLLEGWWRFNDYDLRPDYPLLSRQQWPTLLTECGFQEAAPVDISIPTPGGLQTVFIAKTAEVPVSATSTEQVEQKHWLILADQQGIGHALANNLLSQGITSTLFYQGNQCKQRDENSVNVDNSLSGFQQALASSSCSYLQQLHGIIHLWSIDSSTHAEQASLPQAINNGCTSLVNLFQALPRHLHPQHCQLVTQQALGVNQSPTTGLAQAPVWGMANVLANEHPDIRVSLLDVDTSMETNDAVIAIQAEIEQGRTEPAASDDNHVAIRHGQRFIAKMVSAEQNSATTAFAINPNGHYLITGGLGGLGLTLAAELVNRGARHLLLIGRSLPSAEAQSVLVQLQQQGADITLQQVDVCDQQALSSILQQLPSTYPLCGIFHVAGVLHEARLQQLDQASIQQSVAAKVHGAWNLHLATVDIALDCFVMFSSAASLLGVVGQGAYAAANAYLDSLAHYRHTQQLTALSINWGAWTDVGMVAAQSDYLQQQGHILLTPELGMNYLFQELAIQQSEPALSSISPQVGIMSMDWPRFLDQHACVPTLLAELKHSSSVPVQASIETDLVKDSLVAQLQAVTEHERVALLQVNLQQQLQQSLRTTELPAIDVPLAELGVDSIMNIDLKNQLTKTTGVNLPLSSFIDASVAQLTGQLLEQFNLLHQITLDSNNQTNTSESSSGQPLDLDDVDMEEFVL